MKKYIKKPIKYTKGENYFPHLTDKKMLKKMELYNNLNNRHSKLKNAVAGLLNIHPFNQKKMQELMININGLSKMLKKELNKLTVIYTKSSYRDFINQTDSFNKLLYIYKKFIQNAESFFAEIKNSPTITPPQNEK